MAKKFLSIFIVALLITVPSALASTATQTKSFSGIPNMTGSLTFNQSGYYGGTLTLQSIMVSMTLQTTSARLLLDNDSSESASGTFEFGAAGSISSDDVALLDSSFQPIPGQVNAYHSQEFNLAPDNGDGLGNYDSTGPDGLFYDAGVETDSKSGFAGSDVWNAGNTGFLGTGTFDLSYSITQWFNYNGTGGIEYAFSPASVNGDITVSYTYADPIPEPATISLLTIGALALLKRKRKSSK
jgi:hypothetical protein